MRHRRTEQEICGLEAGPLLTTSALVEYLVDRVPRSSVTVQYLASLPVEVAEPGDVAPALDRLLRGVAREPRVRLMSGERETTDGQGDAIIVKYARRLLVPRNWRKACRASDRLPPASAIAS